MSCSLTLTTHSSYLVPRVLWRQRRPSRRVQRPTLPPWFVLIGRPVTRLAGKASSPSLNSPLYLRRLELGNQMSGGERRQTAAPSGGRSVLMARSCNKVSPFPLHQVGGGVTISRVTSSLLMNPSGQDRPRGSHHADSREEKAPPLSYYSALYSTHTHTHTHPCWWSETRHPDLVRLPINTDRKSIDFFQIWNTLPFKGLELLTHFCIELHFNLHFWSNFRASSSKGSGGVNQKWDSNRGAEEYIQSSIKFCLHLY